MARAARKQPCKCCYLWLLPVSRFHVRKDVAPLKPRVWPTLPRRCCSFHVRKDVAPLKPPDEWEYDGTQYGFHVRKDVAPLKHFDLDTGTLANACFHYGCSRSPT